VTEVLDLDWLISVDDHVIEPADVWQARVPASVRDRAPRLVDNQDAWVFDGKRVPTLGLSSVAGKRSEEFSPEPVSYSEMRPGCYDSQARLSDMDRAGILASLCFPSFPRFCGQEFLEAKDKDLALLCVQAYNDWMIEEWCGSAPGRFIPLVLIPLWDPELASRELGRCAAMGVHAFAFSENTAPLGLPTIHDPDGFWDPVMAAAQDAEMVVCMHVGSSSQIPHIAPDAPFLANLAWGATRTSGTMLSWLFSGYFQRMPKLKIALSEGNIGWIPYFLERAEQVLDKQRHWAGRGGGYKDHSGIDSRIDLDSLDVRQLYRDHVFGCFIDDVHGIASLDVIGEDNVMIETDYPHSDSSWPDSIGLAHKRLGHLAPAVQYKILRGNAERIFGFEAAVPPERDARA
jgi:predicted TIM-barrel fold metal-dependent hydrolase